MTNSQERQKRGINKRSGSKGWRKHVRKQKAAEKKVEEEKLFQKKITKKEEKKSFFGYPPKINLGWGESCPSCATPISVSPKVILETKEGPQQLIKCHRCKKIFRP